jgi:hypothetical protein
VTSTKWAARFKDVKASAFTAPVGTISAFTWIIAGGDSGGHVGGVVSPAGGAGTGFSALISVDAGGFVTTITLVSGGTGYAVGNTPTYLFPDGTGDTITFTVTATI